MGSFKRRYFGTWVEDFDTPDVEFDTSSVDLDVNEL